MNTTYASHCGIILDIKDYNKIYNYIRYCSWNYKGNVLNSDNFFLKPKSKGLPERISIKISNSKKNKGKYYLDDIILCRWHIPEKFIQYIGKDQLTN